MFAAWLISGLASYFLSVHWLIHYQGLDLYWRSALLGWLTINIAVAIVFAVDREFDDVDEIVFLTVTAVTVTFLSIFAGAFVGAFSFVIILTARSGFNHAAFNLACQIAFSIAGLGLGIGVWIRSLSIRIIAVSTTFMKGLKSVPINWKRSLWTEDLTLTPELIPEVPVDPGFRIENLLKGLIAPKDLLDFSISIVTLPIFYLSPLIWRFSLKSTVWFYAPIFLMSKPSDLAKSDDRLRFFTRGPTLWEIWKMCFAVIGITVAVISLIDIFVAFEFWRGLSNEAPLSPIGWLLVMDWERFLNQPWQWFSLPATFLTVFLYLWVNQIRVHRKADIELGQDPELHNSAENHPGITIYWLDRLRNVLVVVSLVIGLWYFVKWAYLEDKLTLLNPWLSSIFGPLPS